MRKEEREMGDSKPFRIGELLMEMLLVNMACASVKGGKIELSLPNKLLLEPYGIQLHEFELGMMNLVRDGNKVIYSGTFKIDYEKDANGERERVRSDGKFKGIINEAGAIRIEYCGENFKMTSEIANMGIESGNIMYRISEITV